MKILVVEDTYIAQKMIESMFVRQGCEVEIADNGYQGLEKALKSKYDVILMDIGLGAGPDGFETTANIKALSDLNKATPIFAVTALNEEEFKQKVMEYGMDGYFNKPFTPENAKAVIDYKKL